jgi:hypothetical protein
VIVAEPRAKGRGVFEGSLLQRLQVLVHLIVISQEQEEKPVLAQILKDKSKA